MGRIPVAILLQPENALVLLARQPDGLLARQVLRLLPLRAPCVQVVHVEDPPHVEQVRLQTRGLRQTTGARGAERSSERTLLRWQVCSITSSLVYANLRWKPRLVSQLATGRRRGE